jgi:hypothetical protein
MVNETLSASAVAPRIRRRMSGDDALTRHISLRHTGIQLNAANRAEKHKQLLPVRVQSLAA